MSWFFSKAVRSREEIEAEDARSKQKWAASSDEEIAAHVHALVVDEFSIEPQHINDEVQFVHIIDSTDGVELIMQCEEDFGFEIPDEDAEAALSGTVADFCAYIIRRVRAEKV